MGNNYLIINGFGRIGRAVFRLLWNHDVDIKCKYIFEPNMSVENLVYLLKYDSIYGKFEGKIDVLSDRMIKVNSKNKEWKINIITNQEYYNFNWNENANLLVVDSSGCKNSVSHAHRAIDNGINNIFITNWQDDADYILTFGYNEGAFNPTKHRIISMGICDSSAVIPIIDYFIKLFTVSNISVVTLHPWLGYQRLLDSPTGNLNCYEKDYQLGRSATRSLIPKETSLDTILKKLFSDYKDVICVRSFRVPTDNVSVADISIVCQDDIDYQIIIEKVKTIGTDHFDVSYDKLVSIDYSNIEKAGVIDFNSIKISKHSFHFSIWYDNEMGYAYQVTKALMASCKQ